MADTRTTMRTDHGTSIWRWLTLSILIDLTGYILYPQQVLMDGLGVVQPVFETVEPIVPQESRRAVRLLVSQGQEVDAGMPVLEYVPHGVYGVKGFARFTKPGGMVDSEPPTDFYREIQEQRIQRMGAVSHWNASVHRPSYTCPAI